MYSRVMKLLNESDGRYLTPAEQAVVLEYARSLPKRFQAARQVEGVEQDAIDQSLAALKRLYPKFADLHPQAWEKATRDMQLVGRFAVQGMLADDLELPADKLYKWMITMLRSVGLTPRFVRDCYQGLRDAYRAKLPADAYGLLEPHLSRAVRDLTAFQEPAVPAVG